MGLENLRDAAEFARNKLKLVNWTNSELDTRFGRRNADEILRDGDCFYMKPCFDFALVFLSRLERGNLISDEVLERGKKKLHFAVQVPRGFLHYLGVNNIFIGRGRYPGFGRVAEVPKQLWDKGMHRIYSEICSEGEQALLQYIEHMKHKNRQGLFESYSTLGGEIIISGGQ